MRAPVDQAGLEAAAAELGRTLPPGAVVWLEGDLGAGKTTFVRALAGALGVTGTTPSPTYNLVHHYEGRRGPVYHVDCFRLRTPAEARELDWDTLRSGDALLIEWPERAGDWAPRPACRVMLEHTGDPTVRVMTLA